MKNHSKFIFTVATVGMIAAVLPFITNAQSDAPTTRARNIENNRDYRNTVMMKRVASSTRPMMRDANRMMGSSTEDSNRDDQNKGIMRKIMMGPRWLSATSTPLGERLTPATLKALQQTAIRFASTTGPEGHEGWKNARLDIFTWMQSHLVSQSQQSLNDLKDLRTRIADRIQTASANGKDMTDAARLLAIADMKITTADTAIQTLTSLTPPVIATSSTSRIDPSTEVSLDKPRSVGNATIKAVMDVRKALNDVVISIAHSLGLGDQNNATTTQQ